MAGFEAGGGVGVEALGPLGTMWRGVYKKAADAAEARLQGLLADHVYHLHGRRAVVVTIDGGGAALVGGEGPDVELPWAYVVEAWSLYAHEAGSLVLDLRRAPSYTAYPALESICAGALPTLDGAQKAQDAVLEGWTTALPRGTVLRPRVVTASGVTFATLSLFVRAV